MTCSECGARIRRGTGRPRTVCSKACERTRDAKRKREGRASGKLSASAKVLVRAAQRELRHWALTGEQGPKPTREQLLAVWADHTCGRCRNGRR